MHALYQVLYLLNLNPYDISGILLPHAQIISLLKESKVYPLVLYIRDQVTSLQGFGP